MRYQGFLRHVVDALRHSGSVNLSAEYVCGPGANSCHTVAKIADLEVRVTNQENAREEMQEKNASEDAEMQEKAIVVQEKSQVRYQGSLIHVNDALRHGGSVNLSAEYACGRALINATPSQNLPIWKLE